MGKCRPGKLRINGGWGPPFKGGPFCRQAYLKPKSSRQYLPDSVLCTRKTMRQSDWPKMTYHHAPNCHTIELPTNYWAVEQAVAVVDAEEGTKWNPTKGHVLVHVLVHVQDPNQSHHRHLRLQRRRHHPRRRRGRKRNLPRRGSKKKKMTERLLPNPNVPDVGKRAPPILSCLTTKMTTTP